MQETKLQKIKIKFEKLKDIITEKSNLPLLLPIAIYLPYQLATIAIVLFAVYVVTNIHVRESIIRHHNFRALALFFMFGITISLYKGNWLGAVAGFAFFLAFTLGQYLKNKMTVDVFEKGMDLISILSVIASIWAMVEVYIIPTITGKSIHRASAMFFYPNYFGNIISIVVIICAYKLLTNQGNVIKHLFIIGMNTISLYLCKSMFSFLEIMVGCTVLLLVLKKRKLLMVWIGLGVLGVFLVLFLNMELIPRLSEAKLTTQLRYGIWSFALEEIFKNPIFGNGFMPYIYLDKSQHMGFLVTHSHSIFFEALLSVGLIGCSILGYGVYLYTKKMYCIIKSSNDSKLYAVILAVAGASCIHGIADLTLMWVQTLPLFLFILSGVGAYEKRDEVISDMSIRKKIMLPSLQLGVPAFPADNRIHTVLQQGKRIQYKAPAIVAKRMLLK